jgi:hypothetical protein
MKQDYFEERLKGILEEGEEQPYDRGQWRRLDRKLRAADLPITPFWLRWLPLAFLMLLGGSVLQHFTLSRQIDALEANLLTVKEVRTTVVYDTVYRRTTLEETGLDRPTGNSMSSQMLPGAFPTFAQPLGGPQLGGFTSPRNTLSPASPTRNDASRLKAATSGKGHFLVNKSLPTFSSKSENLDLITSFTGPDHLGNSFSDYQQRQLLASGNSDSAEAIGYDASIGVTSLPTDLLALLRVNDLAFPTFPAPAASLYSYPKPSVFQRIRPKEFALSASIGGMKETSFLKDDHGWQTGLGLYVGFGERVGLRLGADFLSRSFRIGEDDIERFDFPTAEPRYIEDELESISGSPNLLQLPLGLRVNLLEFGSFSTFTEGGIIATRAFPTEMVYTFEEDAGDEVYYDVTIENGLNHSLAVNAWYGRLGVQYNWPKRWALQLTATRQQGFGDFAYAYGRPDFLSYQLSGVLRW